MQLDRNGLVLFHNYLDGHCRDLSGNENHGTLVNNQKFITVRHGYACKASGTNDNVSVSDSPELRLTEGSFVFYGDFSRGIPIGTFLAKRDAGSLNWQIYGTGSATLNFWDGTTLSSFTFTGINFQKIESLIITKSSASSKAIVFLNGVRHSLASLPTSLVTNTSPVYILNNHIGNSPSTTISFYGVGIYNVAKNAAQVAAIHEYLMQLHTPRIGTRNFYLGPTAGIQDNDGKVVSTWNMEDSNGIVPDEVGTNDGTIEAPVTRSENSLKVPGLYFDAKAGIGTSGINLGSDSSLDFTTQGFGGLFFVKGHPGFGLSTRGIFCRGALNTSGYGFFSGGIAADRGNPNLQIYQAGATQSLTSNEYIYENKIYPIWFYSEPGGNNHVGIEDRDTSLTTVARVDPATHAGNAYIGKFNSTAYKWLGDILGQGFVGEFASLAEFEAKRDEVLRRCYDKIMYMPEFSTPVTVANHYIAGDVIPGTDIVSESCNISVITEIINGKLCKVLRWDSGGRVYIPLQYSNSAYGTTDIWFYKANRSDTGYLGYVCQNYTLTGVSGFALRLLNDNSFALLRLGSGYRFTTAADTINAGEWNKYTFSRSLKGLHTVKLNNINMTAITGSNPIIDTNTTTSKYIVLWCSAGSKIILASEDGSMGLIKKFGYEI